MSITRRSEATWEGSVAKGGGRLSGGSGAFDEPFSLASREGDTGATNPEEMIGAALAGCFTMSLANLLTKEGHPPELLRTAAAVHLEEEGGRFSIPRIELDCAGDVQGVDASRFDELSREAADCPVSRLCSGAEITVTASLGAG
ncbi:MAG: OsmC family peroxiredoxin [Solirubrobacterales bacterium]|nr:OsmC family peroxiredoxin [Solirubrobacterales bacterium]